MAQRLIRVLCKHCKRVATAEELDHKYLALTGMAGGGPWQGAHRGRMRQCNNTGTAGERPSSR
jgi:type II secretory ATPase GspE/PulE/Tfp pilus assembly ATPase PilB-like protein